MEPECHEPKLYVRNGDEVVYDGQTLGTIYSDGSMCVGGRHIGRVEAIALTVALLGRLVTRGVLTSEQSVDEAMHSLEMIAREPRSPF
jgi:hypothetical protein